MKKICITEGIFDCSPRTTESCIYPDVDGTFTIFPYKGRRLVLREEQVGGVKVFGSLDGSYQGMAVYDDLLVRMANGTSHKLYKYDGRNWVRWKDFTLSGVGHSNTLQFAPSKETTKKYPYLYCGCLQKKCVVISLENEDAPSIVQTIDFTQAPSVSDGNLIIGDDGYIWNLCRLTNGCFQFTKFRRISVTDGANIMLTDDDIECQWCSQESYSDITFQGSKVKGGKVFIVYGNSGPAKKGIVVYDSISHAFLNHIDLTDLLYGNEPEDIEVWNDGLLLCTYAASLFQLKF